MIMVYLELPYVVVCSLLPWVEHRSLFAWQVDKHLDIKDTTFTASDDLWKIKHMNLEL